MWLCTFVIDLQIRCLTSHTYIIRESRIIGNSLYEYAMIPFDHPFEHFVQGLHTLQEHLYSDFRSRWWVGSSWFFLSALIASGSYYSLICLYRLVLCRRFFEPSFLRVIVEILHFSEKATVHYMMCRRSKSKSSGKYLFGWLPSLVSVLLTLILIISVIDVCSRSLKMILFLMYNGAFTARLRILFSCYWTVSRRFSSLYLLMKGLSFALAVMAFLLIS